MTQQEKIKRIAEKCGIEVKLHPYEPAHSRGVLVTRSKETEYYPIVFNPFKNADQLLDCIERLAERSKPKMNPSYLLELILLQFHNFQHEKNASIKDLTIALAEALFKYCEK